MYHAIFQVLLGLSYLHAIRSQTCYWPDGSEAGSAYTPCLNGKGPCCYNSNPGHHDLCYDNGFCYSLYFGNIYRGACTDQSFNSDSGCASQCTSGTIKR